MSRIKNSAQLWVSFSVKYGLAISWINFFIRLRFFSLKLIASRHPIRLARSSTTDLLSSPDNYRSSIRLIWSASRVTYSPLSHGNWIRALEISVSGFSQFRRASKTSVRLCIMCHLRLYWAHYLNLKPNFVACISIFECLFCARSRHSYCASLVIGGYANKATIICPHNIIPARCCC